MTELTARLVNLRVLYEDAMNTRDLATQRIWHSAVDGAWPDVTDEIDRLTEEVERLVQALEITNGCWIKSDQRLIKFGARADALAEAVGNLYKPGIAGPWKKLQAALTAFRGGDDE